MAKIVKWPDGFVAIDRSSDSQSFEAEFRRELAPGHLLYNVSVAAIAKRLGDDDVVLELRDGTMRVAEVHLTWRGACESLPWPTTAIFDSLNEWAEARSGSDN